MGAARVSFLRSLGPGLLFAGAAVGVSHLVQSTRAGATGGLAFAGLIVAACVLKYPSFSFGPRYAAATGRSLLAGYARQGRWALVVYALLTFGTMFTVEAAVTLVTAGLAKAVFGLPLPIWAVAALLLAASTALLVAGRYSWLDATIKVVVSLLTLATLAATLLVLPRVPWSTFALTPARASWTPETVAFAAALVGWMPSAIDISVWSSLWTLAKRRQGGHPATVRAALVDFDIGYVGTVLLALCFLVLGAGVMFGSGQEPAGSAVAFATQVVELYASTLGSWSRGLIGFAAFAVMFSTTLTVVDGFPRSLESLALCWRGEDARDAAAPRVYWSALAGIAAVALVIVAGFAGRLRALVDLATTLSFLTGPLLAWLNHRAVTGPEMPAEARPGPWLRAGSLAAVAFLGAIALAYLWVRFG